MSKFDDTQIHSENDIYGMVYEVCGSVMVFHHDTSIAKIVGDMEILEGENVLTVNRYDEYNNFDAAYRFNNTEYSHYSIRTKASFNN